MTSALPFTNRELSWLEFNARVLDEARDPTVPLLERLKFLAIFSSNLDEFFMVRYAGVCRQIGAGVTTAGPDGMPPKLVAEKVARRAHELVELQHHLLTSELLPQLAREGIVIHRAEELSPEQTAWVDAWVEHTLFPVLTPLAVDPQHPFPYLANRSLGLFIRLDPPEGPDRIPHADLVVVPVPTTLAPRFLKLPSAGEGTEFVRLEDAIRIYLPRLFPSSRILSSHVVRVTRDAELDLPEQQPDDLLRTIEDAVRNRRLGAPVRLQYEPGLSPEIRALLQQELELDPSDLYATAGFTALTDLGQLVSQIPRPDLREPPHYPRQVAAFEDAPDIFAAIASGDILLHHPYDDFGYVSKFIQAAAEDPAVLAIKMTLYRTTGDSAIARALSNAARHGKQVAVLVELQARFNEEANIAWARHLEAEGAHVVLGIAGFKTHCKMALVVRREGEGLRRYCHVATGNYNDQTARFYTDLGLFTCNDGFGADLSHLFNLLTSYVRPPPLRHVLFSPTTMRSGLVARIQREVAHRKAGRPAHIIVKLNSLTDPGLILELYEASRAGVSVDLIVRGVCCLRAGEPGWSENLRVRSIVDRFLEHARVYWFDNGGDPECLLSSADWMTRNLDHRIELAFPLLDPALRRRAREILQKQLDDNTKSRILLPDSTSFRPVVGAIPVRSQAALLEV